MPHTPAFYLTVAAIALAAVIIGKRLPVLKNYL